MNAIRNVLRRAAAAVAFGAIAVTGVVTTEAVQAGSQATFAAQPADAAVSVGIGIGFGAPHYYRYGWRNNGWVRIGYWNAAAPGYYANVGYVGWAPPPHPYYYYAHPAYYGYGHYWGHPYWGHPYYAHAYYGHPYYGGWHRGWHR